MELNSINDFLTENDKDYLIYIRYIGKSLKSKNMYQFIFTNSNPFEDIFMEGWSIKPSKYVSEDELLPNDEYHSKVATIEVDMELILGQNSPLFSYMDISNNILAIAYENIDDYIEYPENGRVVIQYGVEFQELKKYFEEKGISFA